MTTPSILFRGAAWRVRQVADGDEDALLQVYHACEDFLALGPVPYASAAMVAQDRSLSSEAGGTYCAICTEAGTVCGVLDFIPHYKDRPGLAYLELLMLAQPYRGLGWGTEIVGALQQHLAASGIRRLLAGVQVNNPAALRFWRRQGFAITGGPELLADQTTAYHLTCEF